MCCYKINVLLFTMYLLACTRVWTVCLHLEQAFETILEEMKLIVNKRKQTEDRIINISVAFIF